MEGIRIKRIAPNPKNETNKHARFGQSSILYANLQSQPPPPSLPGLCPCLSVITAGLLLRPRFAVCQNGMLGCRLPDARSNAYGNTAEHVAWVTPRGHRRRAVSQADRRARTPPGGAEHLRGSTAVTRQHSPRRKCACESTRAADRGGEPVHKLANSFSANEIFFPCSFKNPGIQSQIQLNVFVFFLITW